MRPKGSNTSTLSILLDRAKIGEHFYTDKEDKNVTAQATYKGMKVKTERMKIIEGDRLKPILKVTILSKNK